MIHRVLILSPCGDHFRLSWAGEGSNFLSTFSSFGIIWHHSFYLFASFFFFSFLFWVILGITI